MPGDEWGTYQEDAGNKEPTPKKCNALLVHYRSRYGEPRYCSQPANSNMPAAELPVDHDYCWLHKSRHQLDMRAKELMQHGLFTQTVDHHYSKLDAWQRLIAHGCFESLMADSRWEYAVEFEERVFDFDDADVVPTVPDETIDGVEITVEVPYPTEYPDRAMALWLAACDTVKMLDVQAELVDSGMENETTSHAEYDTSTVPSGDGGEPKSWQTIEEVTEHHLNLPYSRLVRDRKELLKYGGVEVDGESGTETSTAMVFEDFKDDLSADPELVDESESERIREHAGDPVKAANEND